MKSRSQIIGCGVTWVEFPRHWMIGHGQADRRDASRDDERFRFASGRKAWRLAQFVPPLAQRSVLLRELCDISVLNEWSSDSPSDLFR